MMYKENTFVTVIIPFILVSIFVFAIESYNVGKGFTVKTTKLECLTNPSRVTNCTCKLKAVSWNKSVAHMEATLVEPVRNASLRVELYKYTNQFRPFIINETVNVCKWLETRERSNYAGWFLNLMLKFTNINHSCPYTDVIKAENLYFDSRLASFAIPSGTYQFVFTFFEGFPFIYLGTIKFNGVLSENEQDQVPSSRDRLY